MPKFYTGVGARDTPDKYLTIMTDLAYHLDKQGWILRSGGAIGADEAFQKSVQDYSNIFLPHKSFRKGDGIEGVYIDDRDLISEAMYIMSKHKGHPHWEHMINSPSQLNNVKLHTRNVFQVLGADLRSPSNFLVCWTRDGACSYDETSYASGGTGTAIRLASVFNVPIFNLAKAEHELRIQQWIEKMKAELFQIQDNSQVPSIHKYRKNRLK